jgi:hypothetical protein
MDSAGVVFFKLMILLAISPVWFPVIRAIWEEMNLALQEEGGVLGRAPTPNQLEMIRQERTWRPDPLVHEPFASEVSRSPKNGRQEQSPYESGAEQARAQVGTTSNQPKAAPRHGF